MGIYHFPRSLLRIHALQNQFTRAQREGRDGKGIVFVFASGNDRENPNFFFNDIDEATLKDFPATEPYPNLHGVINVGAVDGVGVRAEYLEGGPNLLVVGPSGSAFTTGGSVTADVTGADGYNGGGVFLDTDRTIIDDGNYTGVSNDLVGTSFAAPVVAGLCAQMFSLNPDLTYRDVMHILVESTTRVSPGDANYLENTAGYFYSIGYGFGLIDAPNSHR